MTTNIPAPAQEVEQANPLSDEYVNAVIQRHGYDSPESVIAQLHQWIGLHDGEDSVTLLMYEAHKALSKLRAPVADERTAFEHWLQHDVDPAIISYDKTELTLARAAWAERARRDALASAPVAGESHKGWRLVPEKLTEEMRTAGEVVRSPSGTVSYGLSRHALALAWEALLSAAPSPPATHAAPQASKAQCSCPSGDGSLRWPFAAHAARPGGGRLKQLAAALGNRDWKWWDSCSFRRLTFEDGPQRRDGSALHGTIQQSDGHPDVNMAPGVREFIEAASPLVVGQLADQAARLAVQLRECTDTLGAAQIDEHRAMRAYADSCALLAELDNKLPA
ncbi:hypothetical protein [Achromobacter spanius]|uniref:Uncharacterized protein n=1 Tax=Achromobacter spanius TaxID=217203 RepID=A0A2S0IDT4_9BURK|nr:hypothetical protein [Achromobacter spanius]AVJ30195.1 hypothetical protein CLM73_25550 [Achromobacter spanius]